MVVRAISVVLLAAALSLAQQVPPGSPSTTISDTLYDLGGVPFTGTIYVELVEDQYRNQKTVQASSGAVSLSLYPGKYRVLATSLATGLVLHDVWHVPNSDSPQTLTQLGSSLIKIQPTGGGGPGTVTSVGLSMPATFCSTGSAVTTSGTLTCTYATGQTANRIFGTNASGNVGSFALTTAMLPSIASTLLSDSSSLVRTTDTGSVTNTMLAGSIASAKIDVSSLTANSVLVQNAGVPGGDAALSWTNPVLSISPTVNLTGTTEQAFTGISLYSAVNGSFDLSSPTIGSAASNEVLDYYNTGTANGIVSHVNITYQEDGHITGTNSYGGTFGEWNGAFSYGGDTSRLIGTASSVQNYGGTTGTAAAFWAFPPDAPPVGTVTGATVAYYGGDFTGASTNSYFLWYDSPGVFRIKSDGVMAYYNPAFTKYTPGAANLERIVQQWNTNVAEIGTEAGGTGTLRDLRLIGASVEVPSKLIVALHTPASSSEACTAGQFSDDANFHYVCVSSGVWKRIALSSF